MNNDSIHNSLSESTSSFFSICDNATSGVTSFANLHDGHGPAAFSPLPNRGGATPKMPQRLPTLDKNVLPKEAPRMPKRVPTLENYNFLMPIPASPQPMLPRQVLRQDALPRSPCHVVGRTSPL